MNQPSAMDQDKLEVETSDNNLAVMSADSNLNAMSTVIIKFIYRGSIICTDSFRINTIIAEVKTKMSEVFHEDIEIEKDGAVIDDDVTLTELGAIPLGTIELELKSCSGVDLNKIYRPPPIPTIDVIMVS